MSSSNVIALPAPASTEDPICELIQLFKGAAAAENAAIEGFYAVETSDDKKAKTLGEDLVSIVTRQKLRIVDKICSTRPTTLAGIAMMADLAAKSFPEEKLSDALKTISSAGRGMCGSKS